MIDDEQLREALEVLDGRFPKRIRRSAVRIEHLAALLEIPDRLQAAKAAGAAPTQAEFDLLLRDVEFMRARLFEVQKALAALLTP